MILTDTGGWFAITIPTDPNHVAATQWFAQNRQSLLTTDYIVDETLTLIRARGQNNRAYVMGRQFFSGNLATIYYLTEDDIRQAWQVFTQYADKEWSFTDCTSKVVMEKFGITQAFAFDHHFRQFGTVTFVP
jgi:predicted nucleic acid-binding protein